MSSDFTMLTNGKATGIDSVTVLELKCVDAMGVVDETAIS